MPLLTHLKKKKLVPSLAVPLLLSSSVLLAPQVLAAPTANPNSYTVSNTGSVKLFPLRNDSADAGNYVFIEEVDVPTGTNAGTARVTAGNEITYTPGTNFTGTTTFFYGIKSRPNNLITSAKITVTVTNGNGGNGGGGAPTPPTTSPAPVVHGQLDTVAAGRSISIDALRNDIGSGLTITSVDKPFGKRNNGTFFSTGTARVVNNKISFTADPNFEGRTTFWYRVRDSKGRTNSGPTSVEVTAATGTSGPEANNDRAETTSGRTIWIAPFWNDKGTALKITAVERNTDRNNTAKIDVNGTQIKYTPRRGFSGRDTFDYTITDRFGGKDTATITVAVTGGSPGGGNNTFPRPVANGDAYNVAAGAANVFLNVLNNDVANNGRELFVENFSPNGATTVSGNGIRYTPRANFRGPDVFYYRITDSLGRADSAKVTINVGSAGGGNTGGGNTGGGNTGGGNTGGGNTGGANQSPDAREDTFRIGINPGGNQTEREVFVLSNDVDPNGDNLFVQSVGNARSGSVRLVNGRVLYTPPNFLVSSGFTYVVSDGNGGTDAAAVTIGIVNASNPTTNPIVSGESRTVAPGGTITVAVLSNDNDPDGDTLILDQITGGNQGTITRVGNSIRYTANANASGTDAVFYGVADGQGGNGSGTLTINIQ